jgi:hypothetical protein
VDYPYQDLARAKDLFEAALHLTLYPPLPLALLRRCRPPLAAPAYSDATFLASRTFTISVKSLTALS